MRRDRGSAWRLAGGGHRCSGAHTPTEVQMAVEQWCISGRSAGGGRQVKTPRQQ
uniref:Uncharacterized protein n=1 Tax=Oryza sativa subsp. japonica TaxID=39947 RepID=Q67U35_ORYSJ|nr:hypothetical protein [Oryza sativa Japonica Group]BAD38336.1 hypothetical protein [Oryza sativa Japonica Group]